MFSKVANTVSSFFYSSNISSGPIAFDDDALTDYFGLTNNALAIYRALLENGYQRHTRMDWKNDAGKPLYAAIAEELVLQRYSKHPGSISFEGKQLDFGHADYFVNVNKQGEVRYQIKLKGRYYPIDINDIPDPIMKNIHADIVKPVLAEPLEKMRRNSLSV